jgi:hypothetical protein
VSTRVDARALDRRPLAASRTANVAELRMT